MSQSSVLPMYSKVIYRLSPESKYFLQFQIERQETPINRLPKELRLAPTGAAQIKPNAEKMLLDRPEKGKHKFRTGIQGTYFRDWYLGNDYEFQSGRKVISLMLFHFTNQEQELEVFYFHRYDKPNNTYRLQFANAVIPHLMTVMA